MCGNTYPEIGANGGTLTTIFAGLQDDGVAGTLERSDVPMAFRTAR